MKNSDCAHALYHALVDDAFYITMEASVDCERMTPKEGMVRYMDYSMIEVARYGELLIPQKESYGVSIWSRPLDEHLENRRADEKKAFIAETMGANSLETYQQIVSFMSAMAQPVVDASSWYLSIIGIHPDHQGKGLGKSLISPVLKKTDALNIPTFLETFTPRNMRFYEKLGYRSAASFFEPTTRADYWIMIRNPGK